MGQMSLDFARWHLQGVGDDHNQSFLRMGSSLRGGHPKRDLVTLELSGQASPLLLVNISFRSLVSMFGEHSGKIYSQLK